VGVEEGGLVTAHRAGGRAAITATAGAVSAEIAVRVMDQIVIQRPFTRLFIVNEDGSGLEPLTDAGWSDSEPTWLNRTGFVGDFLMGEPPDPAHLPAGASGPPHPRPVKNTQSSGGGGGDWTTRLS